MNANADTVRTKLVDLSNVSLLDLGLLDPGRVDPVQLSRASEPLVQEVTRTVVVSLAGSDS